MMVSTRVKAETEARLREAIASLDLTAPLNYVNVATLPAIDRQFLVERQRNLKLPRF